MLRCLEVTFVVAMSLLGIVDSVEFSSFVSSIFIKALTTRALVTCCSVNVVLIYLMKPIYVLYLSCVSQVLCFCSVVMMLLSPCIIDDIVLVESMAWWTKKRGNRALRSLMMLNFVA